MSRRAKTVHRPLSRKIQPLPTSVRYFLHHLPKSCVYISFNPMKTISYILLMCSGASLSPAATSDPSAARILASPHLRFEPGPAGSQAFITRGARFQSYLTASHALFGQETRTSGFYFQGASQRAAIEGIDRLSTSTNLIRGNNPQQWRMGIPNYDRVLVHDLYPRVDLLYYGNGGELEYDLIVKPGANPRQVRLRFEGDAPRIEPDGGIKSEFIQRAPVVYQIAENGNHIVVASRYRQNRDGSIGFEVGHYDHTRDLVIDPVLTFSVYLGGSNTDVTRAVGHDSQGFIYVAGSTDSTDFNIAGTSTQGTNGGGYDIFIAQIDPTQPGGSQIINATYFGGSGSDTLGAMAVSAQGQVYLTGETQSSNFPTANAAQGTLDGASDAFVVELDFSSGQTGAVLYSTYFGGGGNESGNAIALDASGRAFIAGNTSSSDFPTVNAFMGAAGGGQDAFVVGIDPSQSAQGTFFYSTLIGGSGWDQGESIAVATNGNLWVAGGTFSFDFPFAGNPYRASYRAGGDAFVAELNPSLGPGALIYSTLLGGSGEDVANAIILDSTGRVLIAGLTTSRDFPVTSSAIQGQYGGNTDAFLSILNPSLSSAASQLVYSTYFGGTGADSGTTLALDSAGNLYLTGYTSSPNLPVTSNALQSTSSGTFDVYLLRLNPAQTGAKAVSFCSYLASDGVQVANGLDLDSKGNVYLAGYTTGPLLDGLGGATRINNGGNTDAFALGLNFPASQ